MPIAPSRGWYYISSKVHISSHYFFETYFRIYLDRESEESRLDTLSMFKQRFIYATYQHSNYESVVSDDRLILIPTMNSSTFYDESLVLELQDTRSDRFKNYLADIDRLTKSGDCRIEDVISKVIPIAKKKK
jgi:hypothetical protein